MDFNKKIINIRKKNNLTQEDFAEILNVSRQTVSNWENEKCYPDIATLIIISNKFKISLDDLLKEDIKLVKDLDVKIKVSKKLKKIIGILIIIISISLVIIYSNNNKINDVLAKNNDLNEEIKKITNIKDNYVIYSIINKDKNINTNDIISIYINDNLLIKNIKVINMKDDYIFLEVPNEIYLKLNEAKINNNLIKIKK